MKTIAIVLCLLVAGVCFADTQKVYLSADIDDDISKNLANSLIRRELRSLGDVEIVDTYPQADWYLLIVLIENSTAGGRVLGYTGVMFLARRDPDTMSLIQDHQAGKFDPVPKEVGVPFGMAIFDLMHSFRPYTSTFGAGPEMRGLVEYLIASVDNLALDRYR